ncbi:GNAT family N-acetyltransferase [Burkholderia vietnamiensis]|jgi:ElaA protein|uniref:GCN5-related N-acetyltransferase n=2 Tax=Burkholderia vietnamiensis TaxID=60552 RepID=A4JCS9_BURVG|nr:MULTISPECIES: GNAT family N-acetyltransferase [Burkholderia]ABO54082.1 GCN5-related N-acetyltransferase [Burkholderia vietnamiensis G4]AFJ85417.1 GCN5-related N-acetyltransferase [Burkholderia sp. KJ006]AJY06694.1 acetyltransferase family protein [Burkholderia vietnamiensis LMG 10929]AOK40482.1 drug:proton antiporter [Burkholderia vietnamiensis]AVR15112.1 GNAT family N-acetyltransferase [Burkholderia vietnamiensis]
MNASASAISPRAADLDWRWKSFDALSAREVYSILEARSAVFVVEQNCVYRDIDDADQAAWHLAAYDAAGRVAGYLRVLLPDAQHADVRIGRVLTTAAFRGAGLGNTLLARALEHIAAQWPDTQMSLHAQAHLQRFYGAFGFEPSSDVHDEDGIPHVWMTRARG